VTPELERLNALPAEKAAEVLRTCCGSSSWVDAMVARRPFDSVEALVATADELWLTTGPADWDEAFAHHPRIGERDSKASLSPTARAWSAGEQSAAGSSDAKDRAALAAAGLEYERRFGRICIVCAYGRSAADLLADLEARLGNDPDRERVVAMQEQGKITELRLRKLVAAEES
jgi:2-oxo-4-hydroxy-4-carboxy-5-ureidoimidazoline decarboxylase